MSKVYDACLFFNEVPMLDLRLKTLNDVVDQFVVIEADRTFKGDPKPYYCPDFLKKLPQSITSKVHYIQTSLISDSVWG